jgi:hypothetical protein
MGMICNSSLLTIEYIVYDVYDVNESIFKDKNILNAPKFQTNIGNNTYEGFKKIKNIEIISKY